MNKKLIWGIVIAVVVVVVAGALYVYQTKDSLVTTPPSYNYQDWKTYKDNKYGVEINYPTKVNWGVGYVDNEEWFTSDNSKDISYSNSLSVGFGTPSSRSGGLIWNLGVMNKADFDLERYIKATGEQFSDRQEKRDKIYVGLTPALLVTVTSESNKDWINKSVIVEKGDKVYVMGNGSINQLKDFQQFYKSLKFTSSVPEVTTNPSMSGGKYSNLVVVSPNGGEKIPYGNITMAGDLGFSWKSQGANYTPTSEFAAYLIDENGAIVRSDFVKKVNPKGNGVFTTSFAGEEKIQINKNYKIRVCDEVDVRIVKCDESDNYFTITSPTPSTLATLKIPASGQTYTLMYPASWVYFKYSCNIAGIAFWPKASAPQFPTGNTCPMSLIDSAPIVITTEGKPELMVNDKSYQEAAKMFTITN